MKYIIICSTIGGWVGYKIYKKILKRWPPKPTEAVVVAFPVAGAFIGLIIGALVEEYLF